MEPENFFWIMERVTIEDKNESITLEGVEEQPLITGDKQ